MLRRGLVLEWAGSGLGAWSSWVLGGVRAVMGGLVMVGDVAGQHDGGGGGELDQQGEQVAAKRFGDATFRLADGGLAHAEQGGKPRLAESRLGADAADERGQHG